MNVWPAGALEGIKDIEARNGLDVDASVNDFMEAEAREGGASSIRTEHLIRVLGLDICGDTEVGNALRPACSPGQKKRVTTGLLQISGWNW